MNVASSAPATRPAIWERIGHQLAHPQGWGGYAIGQMMRVANRTPIVRAIDALAVAPTHRVLDLGCGPGSSVAMLIRRAHRGQVHGVDHSPAMLRLAARRNRDRITAGRVVLDQARFEALPYADARFDRVLAANVCYFWRDLDAVACELMRVMRPGGRLAIYATDAATMRRWRFAGPDTHRHFDAGEMRRAFAALGVPDARIECRALRLFGGAQGTVMLIDKPLNERNDA